MVARDTEQTPGLISIYLTFVLCSIGFTVENYLVLCDALCQPDLGCPESNPRHNHQKPVPAAMNRTGTSARALSEVSFAVANVRKRLAHL